MDAILAKSGLKTIDEMKTKLMALMTPEEWQGYQDQVAELRGHNATLDKILDASLMVAFISGSAGIVGTYCCDLYHVREHGLMIS